MTYLSLHDGLETRLTLNISGLHCQAETAYSKSSKLLTKALRGQLRDTMEFD